MMLVYVLPRRESPARIIDTATMLEVSTTSPSKAAPVGVTTVAGTGPSIAKDSYGVARNLSVNWLLVRISGYYL